MVQERLKCFHPLYSIVPTAQTYFEQTGIAPTDGILIIEQTDSGYLTAEQRNGSWHGPIEMSESEASKLSDNDMIERVGKLRDNQYNQVVTAIQ